MRRRVPFSVEWVPAMLRPPLPCAVPPGIASADSHRGPEDGLSPNMSPSMSPSMSQIISQPFRSAWRWRGLSAWLAFCMALWLALSAPEGFAQPPEASSTSGNPGASTASPPAQSAAAGDKEGMRLAQLQGHAETAALDWGVANSGPLPGGTHSGG